MAFANCRIRKLRRRCGRLICSGNRVEGRGKGREGKGSEGLEKHVCSFAMTPTLLQPRFRIE